MRPTAGWLAVALGLLLQLRASPGFVAPRRPGLQPPRGPATRAPTVVPPGSGARTRRRVLTGDDGEELGGADRDRALGFLVQKMLRVEEALGALRDGPLAAAADEGAEEDEGATAEAAAAEAGGGRSGPKSTVTPALAAAAAERLGLEGGGAAALRDLEMGNRARSQLVMSAMGIVHLLGRKYASLGVLSQQDLEQEGVLGLLKSVERYDPSRANKFSTYAYRYVERAMLDALAAHGTGASAVPAGFFQDMAKFRAAREKLERDLDRPPTVPEIAAEIGVSEDRAELILAQAASVVSLSTGDAGGRVLTRQGGRPLRRLSTDESNVMLAGTEAAASSSDADAVDPQDELMRRNLEAELRSVILDEESGLGADPLAVRLLELRFGIQLGGKKRRGRPPKRRDAFDEDGGLSRESVAMRLGITTAEVEAVEERALGILRASKVVTERLAPYANLAAAELDDLATSRTLMGAPREEDELGRAGGGDAPGEDGDAPGAAKKGKRAPPAWRDRRRRRGVLRKSIAEVEAMGRGSSLNDTRARQPA
mmetsp:Transcript_19703/g.59659  ORF Transcript_19703/g.59659 Transcript_19703/m.59659 type:complete len:540 (-) Transcript_19703:244-1863(-)